MSNKTSPAPRNDSTPLLDKSDLVSQTSHSPVLHEVASLLLRKTLEELYPELNIDPENTFVATPQWYAVNDQVEAGSTIFESLTYVLTRQTLDGTKADYLEGEQFLTLQPEAANPVHLAVSIEQIAEVLNNATPRLLGEMQVQQLDYWNSTGHKIARWQELSDSLRKALNVSKVKGWDADECAMAREVFNDPDRATRKNSDEDLSVIQAGLIDIDVVDNGVSSHLLLGGALVLKATYRKRQLLVMYTIEHGYESFSSLEQLGSSLPARLEEELAGRSLTWRLFEPDGNVFDHMAGALVATQLDAIGSIMSVAATDDNDVEPELGLDKTEQKRLQQLNAAIPQWLRSASANDIQDYGRYITGLGKLYRQPERKKARDEIPSITDYAQRLMREAIIADVSATGAADLPLDKLQIKITGSFTADNLTLPNPLDRHTETLAEFALENEAPYMATVSFTSGEEVPDWLTPTFLTAVAAQVNIGDAYPNLIKSKLIDDPVESLLQERFYSDQLRWLLPLQALEGKVKQEAGIDEHGYQYVCELLEPGTGHAKSVAICPLSLNPQHRLISTSDTVENMYIIGPRKADSGPCLLYRPMLDQPLMQFPSRQNLLYALHQTGELRDSVLAWLPDKTLSFEYAQYVFPVGLPSPWVVVEQLVNPLQRMENAGRVIVGNEEITGDILSRLFKNNAQALVDLADRQSQSNAEQRWTLLKDSSWALFNVASNFLSGAVGAAVWVWQTINEVQQALDAGDRGDSFVEWSAVSDILLTIGIILSHHAVMRRKVLPGRPQLPRPPLETQITPSIEPLTITLDPVPVTAELPPTHGSFLDVAGSIPRRNPAVLGTYLDTFAVAAPDITGENVTKVNATPPHLYQIDQESFAQADTRWFKVMLVGEEQVYIVDPQDPSRVGPQLIRNAKGLWLIDRSLRLRAGAGNAHSRFQDAANALRKEKLEKILKSFKDQEASKEAALTKMQTDIQKASGEDFDRLSSLYATQLDTTIGEYQKALLHLREWRTLGGTENYVYELLRMSTLLQKNLSLWFVIKKNEYSKATRLLVDPGQTTLPRQSLVERVQQATDLSHEMCIKLMLSDSTLSAMRAGGRPGVERALEIRKLAPSFTALDLKTNEIGMAQELCLDEQASPLMQQARDAVGEVVVSAAKAAGEVTDLTKGTDDNRPVQARAEELNRLVDTLADADQRIQELPANYPGLIKKSQLDRLRALIEEFVDLAQIRLQLLLPESDFFPAQGATQQEPPGPSRQPIKVRKTRPRAPSQKEPELTKDEPVTRFKPIIRQNPAPVLEDSEIVSAALELNFDIHKFIERTKKDALRPRRIPADMQDVFDQNALKLEQSAMSVDQAIKRTNDTGGEPLPVVNLSRELRDGAARMRKAGISVRASLYKLRKPTQSAFTWMHDNSQVEISRDARGRIQTRQLGDYFQEYRIVDKTNNKPLWVAHFHYEKLDSPADKPTAAHLKVADDYLKTLTAEQQQTLNTFQPIDGVLRKMTDPAVRKLFLDL